MISCNQFVEKNSYAAVAAGDDLLLNVLIVWVSNKMETIIVIQFYFLIPSEFTQNHSIFIVTYIGWKIATLMGIWFICSIRRKLGRCFTLTLRDFVNFRWWA